MEVHKHPHHVTHKKKWGEYFLEFLMIFLAVFLGFVAENLRENLVEKHREKQYIISLVQDLEDDRKALEDQMVQHKTNIARMDSFIAILNTPALIPKSGDELYYFGRLAPRIRGFSSNMRTFEQLKNSGNFRLISDPQTSTKIMAYYEKIAPVLQLQDIFANEFIDFKRLAAQVFEPAVFVKQQTETNDVVRTTNNPPLQNTNTALLKQLAIYAVYMNGSRRSILVYDQQLLQAAGELILFLRKEYHLE